jgi:SAM-dependent methyltransferase
MTLQPPPWPRLHETPELLDLFSPSAEQSREEIAFYAEAIRKAQRAGERCRALELGVGTGRVFFGLAAEGVELIGLDRNEAFLSVCRERAERLGVAATFERGDMRRMPSAPSVRAILCPCGAMSMLRTVDELRDFFASVAGRIEPGGVFAAELWVATRPPDDLARHDSDNGISDERALATLRLLGRVAENLPLRVQTRVSPVPGEPWLFRAEGRILGGDGAPLYSDFETGRVWEPAALRAAIEETARDADKRAGIALRPCYDWSATVRDPRHMERLMLVVAYHQKSSPLFETP